MLDRVTMRISMIGSLIFRWRPVRVRTVDPRWRRPTYEISVVRCISVLSHIHYVQFPSIIYERTRERYRVRFDDLAYCWSKITGASNRQDQPDNEFRQFPIILPYSSSNTSYFKQQDTFVPSVSKLIYCIMIFTDMIVCMRREIHTFFSHWICIPVEAIINVWRCKRLFLVYRINEQNVRWLVT